jgi:hypothetical protein
MQPISRHDDDDTFFSSNGLQKNALREHNPTRFTLPIKKMSAQQQDGPDNDNDGNFNEQPLAPLGVVPFFQFTIGRHMLGRLGFFPGQDAHQPVVGFLAVIVFFHGAWLVAADSQGKKNRKQIFYTNRILHLDFGRANPPVSRGLVGDASPYHG